MREGRVLVVAASKETRKRLEATLAEPGFEVVCCGSAELGLEKARLWDPQVIVLDIDLFTVLSAFKKDDLSGSVPLLMHSSQAVADEVVVRALDEGASDFLARPYSDAILAARVAAHIAAYRAQVELREKVIRDQLTGVFSRRYLFESMRAHVNQFSRPGPPVLCCLMIDVDHFKLVNDRLGHIEGDRILRQVAKLIFAMTRKGDVVARFGGEEFVVVLPSTDPEGARLVADKLRKAVEVNCGVTISIGVSWYASPVTPEDKSPYSDEEMMHLLLGRADAALYTAKREGRNRVCLQADYGGPERRRLPRLEASFPVLVADVLRHAMVSAGGLALQDSSPLTVGDEINLRISLESGVALARGRVVWTYSVRGGTSQEERCGVAFESFAGDGQERLYHEIMLSHNRPSEPVVVPKTPVRRARRRS